MVAMRAMINLTVATLIKSCSNIIVLLNFNICTGNAVMAAYVGLNLNYHKHPIDTQTT